MLHSTFHPAPVQYVLVDGSFNANEAMARNAYISDDISGYRFPTSPERPHSQHYHLQHSHMTAPADSGIYGGYPY